MTAELPPPEKDAPPTAGEATHGSARPSASGTAAEPLTAMEEASLRKDVEEFLAALEKAARARRLYQANNPSLHGFLQALHRATTRLWDRLPALQFAVEEDTLRWRKTSLNAGEGRDNLAFLFYKDGIRNLSFEPGFEDEVEAFLGVVSSARSLDPRSEDDMVTLLWEADLAHLEYTYVDALQEGMELPEGGGSSRRPETTSIDLTLVEADRTETDPAESPPAVAAGAPSVAASIQRDDFSETLYFLDTGEMQELAAEVDEEWRRDVRHDVLLALFDRLEDPVPSTQIEILRILRQILPAFLGRGDLASASMILVELNTILQGDALDEAGRAEAERLYAELSEPMVLRQLLDSLESGSIEFRGQDLAVFLSHLGPGALPLLVRSSESSAESRVGERLRGVAEDLARSHPEQLVELVGVPEPEIVLGAVRLAGRLELGAAAQAVVERLLDPVAALRRAAVEALVRIRTSVALDGIQRALEDPDREVRIAAARGLATLRYQPARSRLEELLDSKQVKDADLTEKIAFFEAFGTVADAASVSTLDRLLNGRKLFGKTSPDVRACAAMALGRVSAPAARTSLQKAADDTNPMVRNAVAKALRGERAEVEE
ncbi:MAG: HEAT repeat domain-containing protein [Gemmatimonadota bacterium]